MNHITIEQVRELHNEDETQRFLQFMDRQTCPVVDGAEAAFYRHDYERWLSQEKPTQDLGMNWD